MTLDQLPESQTTPSGSEVVKSQVFLKLNSLKSQINTKTVIDDKQVSIDPLDPTRGIYRGICELSDSAIENDVTIRMIDPKVNRDSVDGQWKLDEKDVRKAFPIIDTSNMRQNWISVSVEANADNPLIGRYKGFCKLSSTYSPGGTTQNSFTLELKHPAMKRSGPDAEWELDRETIKNIDHIDLTDYTIDNWVLQ